MNGARGKQGKGGREKRRLAQEKDATRQRRHVVYISRLHPTPKRNPSGSAAQTLLCRFPLAAARAAAAGEIGLHRFLPPLPFAGACACDADAAAARCSARRRVSALDVCERCQRKKVHSCFALPALQQRSKTKRFTSRIAAGEQHGKGATLLLNEG